MAEDSGTRGMDTRAAATREQIQAMWDRAEWGEPHRARKSEKRIRDAVVSVRFSPAEFAELCKLAELHGKTLSAFLREQALAAPYAVVR